MISKAARLRAKKGFTLIEIIVVIAIIGILTSITVAAISYDNKPVLGKDIAKSAYYVAQDAASSLKITNPNSITTDRVGYFVRIDNNGNIVESGYLSSIDPATTTGASDFADADLSAPGAIVHDGSADDELNCFKQKMFDSFENYLTSTDGMAGTIFVAIDKNFRVDSAYWKEGGYLVYYGATGYFTKDNVLDSGEYCCAYPPNLSQEGKYFFGK